MLKERAQYNWRNKNTKIFRSLCTLIHTTKYTWTALESSYTKNTKGLFRKIVFDDNKQHTVNFILCVWCFKIHTKYKDKNTDTNFNIIVTAYIWLDYLIMLPRPGWVTSSLYLIVESSWRPWMAFQLLFVYFMWERDETTLRHLIYDSL